MNPLQRLASYALCALSVVAWSLPVRAQTGAERLGQCLADSTTGKERKDLARWLFTAMSAHPDMRSIATIAPSDVDAASQTAAAVFTKLLADSCAKEVKLAMSEGGAAAIQVGFGVLGQLAMQELMTNPQVGAAMAVLDRYIDKPRIESALR